MIELCIKNILCIEIILCIKIDIPRFIVLATSIFSLHSKYFLHSRFSVLAPDIHHNIDNLSIIRFENRFDFIAQSMTAVKLCRININRRH